MINDHNYKIFPICSKFTQDNFSHLIIYFTFRNSKMKKVAMITFFFRFFKCVLRGYGYENQIVYQSIYMITPRKNISSSNLDLLIVQRLMNIRFDHYCNRKCHLASTENERHFSSKILLMVKNELSSYHQDQHTSYDYAISLKYWIIIGFQCIKLNVRISTIPKNNALQNRIKDRT